MKNVKEFRCECGQKHESIPRAAVFKKIMGNLDVLSWHCVCERELNVQVELAEPHEIDGVVAHATFAHAMHVLRQTNLRTSKR